MLQLLGIDNMLSASSWILLLLCQHHAYCVCEKLLGDGGAVDFNTDHFLVCCAEGLMRGCDD